MTAPARARAAPAPGAARPKERPRRVTSADYSHLDVACSSCGMSSWACSRLELVDDRPFPLKACCSDCLVEDVHNALGT